MQLWKLSYVSIATAPNEILDADVREICRVAQKHNVAVGITGILTFNAGRFAQLIEGSEGELRALMRRITADPRHHSLKVMADYSIVARQFGEWSMAYRSPSEFVRDQIDGLIEQTRAAK